MKSGYREPARSTWLRPLGISIIDWALAIGAIAAVLHVPLIPLDELAFRVGNPSHTDVFLGGTLILVLLEATRRSVGWPLPVIAIRSEEHTSELQSLMRISYAVFCLKKKK